MDTKNEIRKRMIATAAKSWGINIKDMQKVDPLIPLLIDACSSELERISSSIEDARHTMGNQLMELVTPKTFLSPYPSRAIMHAQPFNARFKITEDHRFYATRNNPINEESEPFEVFFTSVANQMLINGEVKYLATGKTIALFESPYEKETICKAKRDKTLPPACLWLGISANKAIESLEEVAFYFDLENADEYEEKAFNQALSTSLWYLNDSLIGTKTGFELPGSGDNSKQINLPLTDFSKVSAVRDHIINFYKKKFITITEKAGENINYKAHAEVFPSIFSEVFELEELEEKIDSKYLWIKVEFTQHLPEKVFTKLLCAVNCIPIINRKSEQTVISGRERIKELNAEENEQFFDLKSISCEDKLEIIFEQQKLTDMEGKAFFSLRHDNIGRFNKRNALETIRHLNDVYYEEYVAFSRIKGLEHEHLDELNRAVRPFENIFEEHYQSSLDSMPYLMLKTDTENEEIDVDVYYWLTNGTLANGIKRGDVLRCDSAELVRDKIFLIIPTMGGTDRKRSDDLVNEFRYALLTNDRIVTLEDIKSLVYKQFGKFIENVTVVKDVVMDASPGSGHRRIIKVQVKLKKNIPLKVREAEFLKQDVEAELAEKSLNAIPIIVSID